MLLGFQRLRGLVGTLASVTLRHRIHLELGGLSCRNSLKSSSRVIVRGKGLGHPMLHLRLPIRVLLRKPDRMRAEERGISSNDPHRNLDGGPPEL